MGTRFLLTSDSPVAAVGQGRLPAKTVNDTVLTLQVDGVPQRVLRDRHVEELEHTAAAGRLPRAVRNAFAFQKLSGTPWRDLVREGLAMRRPTT